MRRTLACFVLLLAVAPLARASVAPVCSDDFEGGALDPAWVVDASEGNSVAAADGRLVIRAAMNTYAHVERPLARDCITTTVRLMPGSPCGISWGPGVLLYWSPGVWCQFGAIDANGGCFYAVEALGGTPAEHYLGACSLTAPHGLRIELGSDCVRFLSRDEGASEWTLERALRRPPEWRGAPKLLVLGKGYDLAGEEYASADLDNDYADRGAATECWFDDLTVEATPRDRLRLLPEDLRPRGDAVGERLLAEPGDPSFDQVAAVYPPMKHPREAVGPKWHAEEIGVEESCGLDLLAPNAAGQMEWTAGLLCLGEDATPFGSGVRLPDKRLLDGSIPVVVATWEHGGVYYTETVLGYTEGLADTGPLWAVVRLEARTDGPAARIPVSFRLDPERPGIALPATTLEVAPGAPASCAFRIPYRLGQGLEAEVLSLAQFDSMLEETRRFWQADLAKGAQFVVPEQRVMEAQRAWLAYNAIGVDRVGDTYEAHDGSGFYEEVYAYSAARYAIALDAYGRHDEAKPILEALRLHQQPDGLLEWNFGLTDTGTYLCAVVEHYRLTRDESWLRSYVPSLLSACHWLTTARAASHSENPVTDGLITHRSYCDYATPVCGYLHNCYGCVGMERAAEALAAIGLTDDAGRIAREAAAFRADILRSMDAATIVRDGRRILPMEPDTQRLLRAVNYESRDYYSLIAGTLLECGFLPHTGEQAREIRAFLRDLGGIQMGTCEFARGIDHAYAYGYLEGELASGDPERYILGFYTALAYGMTRGTYSSVECTGIRTGENAGTLPHLYSGSQQLLMLRTMLLREEGNTLEFLSAVPRPWLGDGKAIEVAGAPTRFGTVDLRVESRLALGFVRIDLAMSANEGRQPSADRYVLHLRHPEGKPIASVLLDGQPWADFAAETVTLPGGSGRRHVVVSFAP